MRIHYANANTHAYRYSFQGQEKDDEVKGSGNSVNYKYRMHDPRIGRFFAVDPLAWKFPYLSPYQFASNSPIVAIELEGLESSARLNYNEGSIELKHDGTKYVLISNTATSSGNIHQSSGNLQRNGLEEGGHIDVWVPNKDIKKSGGYWLRIEIGTDKVLRKEIKEKEKLVSIPNSVDGICPVSVFANELMDFVNGVEQAIDNLEENSIVEEINVTMAPLNHRLGTTSKSELTKALQDKYPGVKINVTALPNDLLNDGLWETGNFEINYSTPSVVMEQEEVEIEKSAIEIIK